MISSPRTHYNDRRLRLARTARHPRPRPDKCTRYGGIIEILPDKVLQEVRRARKKWHHCKWATTSLPSKLCTTKYDIMIAINMSRVTLTCVFTVTGYQSRHRLYLLLPASFNNQHYYMTLQRQPHRTALSTDTSIQFTYNIKIKRLDPSLPVQFTSPK